jgi:hypothetical protein
MQARQCLRIVGAQPGVGPITALSVAARIAKQRLDLLDPLPIRTCLRRQHGAFCRRKTVEPLAGLECGVLHLDIAPITCWVVTQDFIGARDGRAVLIRARGLRHRCRAVVADGPVEIEETVSLFRGPAVVGGELGKRIGKLRLVGGPAKRWCVIGPTGTVVRDGILTKEEADRDVTTRNMPTSMAFVSHPRM